MNSINTINGVLVAAQSDFIGHAENKTMHLTEEERDVWNAKAEASTLSGKVDTGTITAPETNVTLHVTQEEREKWNTRNTKGAMVATQDGLDEHTENTAIHITSEERDRWNNTPELDAAGNMALGGELTAAGVINAIGGVNIPVAPPTPMHAARLVDVQRSVLAGINYYRPSVALVSARLGTVFDQMRGLNFGLPASPVRGISAVSVNTDTSTYAQSRPAIIKITLTLHQWCNTMICVSNAADIIDSIDSPLLSSGAIAQLSINEEDANNAYTIYDSTGSVVGQGTLPRRLKGHNVVVDYYVVVWRDRIYFYQGACWTNRESQIPGDSYELPLYLGYVPRDGYYGMVNLIIAKGTNAHQWGQSPAGVLQSITEFRLDDAGVFFPNLND